MRAATALACGVGLVACGPAVATNDETSQGTSSGADVTSTTGADSSEGGAEATATPQPTTAGSESSTGPGSTTGGSDSTGSLEFSDEQVLGGWLCEGGARPFFMRIEAFTSPYDVTGVVCMNDEGEPDPTNWEPCGELTVHPAGGGGPFLWIYPVFDTGLDSFSVLLLYQSDTDTFLGMWSGPGADDVEGAEVACVRVR